MTPADQALLADWRAGKIKTRAQHLSRHVGTIDRAEELTGFIEQAKAEGVYEGEVREACLRRMQQLSG